MEITNDGVTEVTKTALFTPKKIIRVLSLLCIVFVFCPVFLVSCSGQQVDVNVMTAVGGMSMYGEVVVEPHPIMLICLIIPVALLITLFLKKIAQKKLAMIALITMIVDFIVWIIFKTSVQKIADANYCTMETTVWYYFNMISMALIVIFAFLILINKMHMDTDLKALVSGSSTQDVISQMSATMSQMTSAVSKITSNVSNKISDEDKIGFCSKCGTVLIYGSKFCTSCGTGIPAAVLEEAELRRKELLEKQVAEVGEEAYCEKCGTKLEADAAFCEQCGTKVN